MFSILTWITLLEQARILTEVQLASLV